jgi:hypothetical protein
VGATSPPAGWDAGERWGPPSSSVCAVDGDGATGVAEGADGGIRERADAWARAGGGLLRWCRRRRTEEARRLDCDGGDAGGRERRIDRRAA